MNAVGRYLHLPPATTSQPPRWVGQYTHPTTQTAPDAAKYVRSFLGSRMLPTGTIDLAGIVSYHLVENAVKWGEPTIRVTVVVDADGIQVAVHDCGRTTVFGPDGYGFTIVHAIASSLETLPDISGKTVAAVVPYERKR